MNLEKVFVGIDDLFNLPFGGENYPRYNIGKVQNGYSLEMALPGWDPKQVSITFQDGVLKVNGDKQEVTEEPAWMHKGISSKSFTKAFKVNSNLEVKKAEFDNGMLRVSMEYTPATEAVKIPIEAH